MQIRQILDKIDDHQLFVPAFQREYVWKRADAKALFTSLMKRYPTGTLLSWETTRPPELKGPKKYLPDMGAVKLILDGQQRITTIYMIMRGKLPPYYRQEEIKNDVTGLYVNVQTSELEYFRRQQMQNNPLWVNLTDIFTATVQAGTIRRAMKEAGRLDDETELAIDTNFEAIRSIQDRDFLEQVIPVTASIKEAIDIFYIVNASGVNLTDAELALAQISGYWPEARELFKAKLVQLKAHGFDFKLDFVVYVLLAVLYGLGSDMRKLHDVENRDALQAAWARLDGSVLDYVLNLLRTHAYVDHSDEINSPFAIIPLIAYVFTKPALKLSEAEIRHAIKWFFYAQLRQRYISQTPQRLDKDLSVVRDAASPFEELLSALQIESKGLEITADEFVGRDIRHPLFSLMRWYFKSRDAVCLGTGVGLRKPMGPRYALENDHVFPYSALRDSGYPVDNRFKYALAQELTNRAILTQVENRAKSAQPAADYLAEASGRFPGALSRQCIPADPQLWQLDRYEDFLVARRAMLAQALNTFLAGITATAMATGAPSLDDLIAEREHDELEFKTTLRWDTRESRVNKVLEQVVLKSIAALANARGGTLLIGVADDGAIYGLDADYASLGGDRDLFERHLRQLATRCWGAADAANAFDLRVTAMGDQEIAVVGVRPGARPLFVPEADKNGSPRERLFVRTGNASPAIESASEQAAYIARRFPQWQG